MSPLYYLKMRQCLAEVKRPLYSENVKVYRISTDRQNIITTTKPSNTPAMLVSSKNVPNE